MATPITKKVGTAGAPTRDYSSLTAWESDRQRNLMTADEIEMVECYNDGVMSDNLTIDGWITDDTRYIKVFTPDAERHDGTLGTGFRLDGGSSTHTFKVKDPNVCIEGLSILNTSASYTCIVINMGIGATTWTETSHNLLDGNGIMVINNNNANTNHYIWNNFVIALSYGIRFYFGNVSYISYIYSNSVYGGNEGIGIQYNTGNAKLINNVALGCATYDYRNPTYAHVDSEFNASTAAAADPDKAPGSDCLYELVAADNYFSLAGGAEDLHIKDSDAVIFEAGTSLAADPNLPFDDDIDGETRGATWDMGGDYLKSFSTMTVGLDACIIYESTSTVGTDGGLRDYTTFAAWESDKQRDLVAANEREIVLCYNDGVLYENGIIIDGWTTDETRYIHIRTPSSERHTGKKDTGFKLYNDDFPATMTIKVPNVWIEGLEIYEYWSGRYSIVVDIASGTGFIKFNQNFGYGGGSFNIIKAPSTISIYIWNNFFHNSGIHTHGPHYGICDTFFLDANNGWAVGYKGAIYHTSNGGTTWTSQTSGVSITLRSVNFVDANNGWIVGSSATVLHTTDGGANWAPQDCGVPSHYFLYGVSVVSTSIAYICGEAKTLKKTINGGVDWYDYTTNLANETYTSIQFVDTVTGWVNRGEAIYWTTNGGLQWYPFNFSVELDSSFGASFFHFYDADNGYAVGSLSFSRRRIFKTEDGGENWSEFLRAPETYAGIYSDGSNIWVLSDWGELYHQSAPYEWWDWTLLDQITTKQTISLSKVGNEIWIGGKWGIILYSSDAGSSFAFQKTDDVLEYKLYVYSNSMYLRTYGINVIPFDDPETQLIVKNNAFLGDAEDVPFDGKSLFSTSSTNNASSVPTGNFSAPGSNPLDSILADDNFVATSDLHVKNSDADIRHQGADLSGDPNFPFYDDIDDETRETPWDIGADESFIDVNTVEVGLDAAISSLMYVGFDARIVDVPKIVIGLDAIIGDRPKVIPGLDAYISFYEKVGLDAAILIRKDVTVGLDAAIEGDFSTATVGIAGAPSRDYSTLTAWEADRQRDLVTANEVERVACYNDGVMSTGVDIDGWTTDGCRYIKIYTPLTERFYGPDLEGLTINAYQISCIIIRNPNVWIEGFVLRQNNGRDTLVVNINDGYVGWIKVSQNIFYRHAQHRAVDIKKSPEEVVHYIWNNFFRGMDGPGTSQSAIRVSYTDNLVVFIYSNSVFGEGEGIQGYRDNGIGEVSLAMVKNTVSLDCPTSDYLFRHVSTNDSENNASSDGSHPGSSPVGAIHGVDNFRNVATPDDYDLRIKDADADIIYQGIDLSGDSYLFFLDDIFSVPRGPLDWALGAAEHLNLWVGMDAMIVSRPTKIIGLDAFLTEYVSLDEDLDHQVQVYDVLDEDIDHQVQICTTLGSHYEITEQTLTDLEAAGVPGDVIIDLQGLVGQEFIGEENFLDAVTEEIGEEHTAEYGELISTYACLNGNLNHQIQIYTALVEDLDHQVVICILSDEDFDHQVQVYATLDEDLDHQVQILTELDEDFDHEVQIYTSLDFDLDHQLKIKYRVPAITFQVRKPGVETLNYTARVEGVTAITRQLEREYGVSQASGCSVLCQNSDGKHNYLAATGDFYPDHQFIWVWARIRSGWGKGLDEDIQTQFQGKVEILEITEARKANFKLTDVLRELLDSKTIEPITFNDALVASSNLESLNPIHIAKYLIKDVLEMTVFNLDTETSEDAYDSDSFDTAYSNCAEMEVNATAWAADSSVIEMIQEAFRLVGAWLWVGRDGKFKVKVYSPFNIPLNPKEFIGDETSDDRNMMDMRLAPSRRDIINDVTWTYGQAGTKLAPVTDDTSIALYGRHSLNLVTKWEVDITELQVVAGRIITRYSNPINKVTFSASNLNEGLGLNVELGEIFKITIETAIGITNCYFMVTGKQDNLLDRNSRIEGHDIKELNGKFAMACSEVDEGDGYGVTADNFDKWVYGFGYAGRADLTDPHYDGNGGYYPGFDENGNQNGVINADYGDTRDYHDNGIESIFVAW